MRLVVQLEQHTTLSISTGTLIDVAPIVADVGGPGVRLN